MPRNQNEKLKNAIKNHNGAMGEDISAQSPTSNVGEQHSHSPDSPTSVDSVDRCGTPIAAFLAPNTRIYDDFMAGENPIYDNVMSASHLQQVKPSAGPDLVSCLAGNPYAKELIKILCKRPKPSDQNDKEYEETQQRKEAKLKEVIQSFVPTKYQSKYISQPAHRNPTVLDRYITCPVEGCGFLFSKVACGAFHFDAHSDEEVASLTPAQHEYFTEIFKQEDIRHFKNNATN